MSALAGILNPCDRAGSCRLGQPGPQARTTITVVPQNPKPGPKFKGWRQKSKPRRRPVPPPYGPSPSEPGEIAVDCGESQPLMPKALSPVPSLRRRGQGRDGRQLRGKQAVHADSDNRDRGPEEPLRRVLVEVPFSLPSPLTAQSRCSGRPVTARPP